MSERKRLVRGISEGAAADAILDASSMGSLPPLPVQRAQSAGAAAVLGFHHHNNNANANNAGFLTDPTLPFRCGQGGGASHTSSGGYSLAQRNYSIDQLLQEMEHGMTIGDGKGKKATTTTAAAEEDGSHGNSVMRAVGSVVQIFATGIAPDYGNPWSMGDTSTWTGSGFCIDHARIVTNCHVVHNHTLLQVQRQDTPRKWRAHVVALAHDLDLAVLRVDDADAFWNTSSTNTKTATLAQADTALQLYTEVNCIGFPQGGSTLCVTKGVVSRFDAQLYVHAAFAGIDEDSANSPGNVFVLQVDSAINPGNSGGPAISHDGKVVGVASSGDTSGQNIGYVIPVSIVHLFLDEVAQTGSWSGVSELGLSCQMLESETYRNYLGMTMKQQQQQLQEMQQSSSQNSDVNGGGKENPENNGITEEDSQDNGGGVEKEDDDEAIGVLVRTVAPLGALHGKILPGDILTHMDDLPVSNEGRVPVTLSGQTVNVEADALVTCKPKGQTTKFTIMRRSPRQDSDSNNDGIGGELEAHTLSVEMKPIPPLAPRYHGVDSKPDYVVLGGLVFSRATVPLLRRYNYWYHVVQRAFNTYKQSPDQELVVLQKILRHDMNVGAEASLDIVRSVDGVPIKNLQQLADLASSIIDGESENTSKFVEIYLDEEDHNENFTEKSTGPWKFPSIVLERAAIPLATPEICHFYGLTHPISPSLRPDEDKDVGENDDNEEHNEGEGE